LLSFPAEVFVSLLLIMSSFCPLCNFQVQEVFVGGAPLVWDVAMMVIMMILATVAVCPIVKVALAQAVLKAKLMQKANTMSKSLIE
jgi:hypothetical protein